MKKFKKTISLKNIIIILFISFLSISYVVAMDESSSASATGASSVIKKKKIAEHSDKEPSGDKVNSKTKEDESKKKEKEASMHVMKAQIDKASLFRSLHKKGVPLILFNIWDAGSAGAVQKSGAQAIATGSWSVAASHGVDDGEVLPLDIVIANVKRITTVIRLPVTVDLEAGYGEDPAAVRDTVQKVIAAGAVGINLEDQNIRRKNLYSVAAQTARIQAAREAAQAAGIPIFINARTDVFFHPGITLSPDQRLIEAIKRAEAYASAGADGIFVPGLVDLKLISTLCSTSPIPVNIMMLPSMSAEELSKLSVELPKIGVARISYGPKPYIDAMQALTNAAKQAFGVVQPYETAAGGNGGGGSGGGGSAVAPVASTTASAPVVHDEESTVINQSKVGGKRKAEGVAGK